MARIWNGDTAAELRAICHEKAREWMPTLQAKARGIRSTLGRLHLAASRDWERLTRERQPGGARERFRDLALNWLRGAELLFLRCTRWLERSLRELNTRWVARLEARACARRSPRPLARPERTITS